MADRPSLAASASATAADVDELVACRAAPVRRADDRIAILRLRAHGCEGFRSAVPRLAHVPRTASSRACSATSASDGGGGVRSQHPQPQRRVRPPRRRSPPLRLATARRALPNIGSDCSTCRNSVKPAPFAAVHDAGIRVGEPGELLTTRDLRLRADGSRPRPIAHDQLHDFALGSVLGQQPAMARPGRPQRSRHTPGLGSA